MKVQVQLRYLKKNLNFTSNFQTEVETGELWTWSGQTRTPIDAERGFNPQPCFSGWTVINCSGGPVSKPAKSLSFLALSWGKFCVTLTHLPWQHTRWHTHLFTSRFVSNKAKFLLLLKTTDCQKTMIGPQVVVFSFPDENLCHRFTAASR